LKKQLGEVKVHKAIEQEIEKAKLSANYENQKVGVGQD